MDENEEFVEEPPEPEPEAPAAPLTHLNLLRRLRLRPAIRSWMTSLRGMMGSSRTMKVMQRCLMMRLRRAGLRRRLTTFLLRTVSFIHAVSFNTIAHCAW